MNRIMAGLHVIDILVLVTYLSGITLLGIWMARRIKTFGDFLMPRRFGKSMMIMHTFGTGTHSDQAVSVASKTFTSGISGIWYQWLWLFATPFYWLIAPIMRRFRALTVADVFEARYNRSVAGLYALIGMLQLMVNTGVMLKGSGAMITASTGGLVSSNNAILIMTVLFVLYGMAGGLSAAIVTDFIQGILTIIFSFMLLPFVLSAVNGLSGLHKTISNPEMFSLVAPAEIGFFYAVVIAVNALVGIVTQPHIMGNCAAGRTETEGRVGLMVGSLLKRICTIAWCFVGLTAVALYVGQDVEPDQVYGRIARDFFSMIMPGMLGIFLASLLASVMSSCDSFMIASSGLFTENIYKHLITNRSQNHYLLVARITSLWVVGGGVIFAYWLPGVIRGLEIFWKIASMMGLAFWLGLFWRKMTAAGAWASTLAASAMWWLTTQQFFVSFVGRLPLAHQLRFVVEKEGLMSIYLPWQMIFYLVIGFAAGILISLFTKPIPHEKLENFYSLMRTPIKPGEYVAIPCTLPKDAVIPLRRNIFPKSNLEIPIPTKISILGFVFGWIAVVMIIATFVLIIKA